MGNNDGHALSEPEAADKPESADIQPHDWQKLTPAQVVRLANQWSIKSWFFVLGILCGLIGSSWAAGYAYRAGSLPKVFYIAAPSDTSPVEMRERLEAQRQFAEHYDELIDWRTLRAIAASIAMHNPDGLDSEFEIAAAFLAQIRATRGEARFLAGDEEIRVRLDPTEGGVELAWEEAVSIIPRIAADAGYELTQEEQRVANSNLNWAQFTYLDDDMQHAVVYRDLEGDLSLLLLRR